MKELKPAGNVEDVRMRFFYDFEPGDSLSIDDKEGITKDEFLNILDKASQPIDRSAKSDSEKSGT